MTSLSPGQALSEIIAHALVAELSDQQLGAEAAWHDPEFRDNALRCGEAVMSAIEAAGYAVVPLEPTEEMQNAGIPRDRSKPVAEIYRDMLAWRPR